MKNINQIIFAALLSSLAATPAVAAKIIRASGSVTPASAPAASAVTAAPANIVIASAPQAVSAAAQVASPPPPPPRVATPATSNSGFYVGAQLGDSTIGALLGYQFSKMYAMELTYDYVDPKYTPTTTLEKSRAGISGLALFPIKFNEMGPMAIYIKVGHGRTTEKLTVNDPGLGIPAFPATTTQTTTLTTGVTASAGAQVELSNNTRARLGVNYVGGDRSVTLAAIYKF